MHLHIEQRRGGHLETLHPVSVRVVERGEVVGGTGPDVGSFWRSSAKPMQLVTSLLNLPDDVVDALSDEDLAVGAASHSGQPVHVARVEALLTRFGLSEDGLRCGAHPPMHEESARALVRAGAPCTALHNNCSGKHAFMLAASRAQGWDLDYRSPEHPLQVENRARLGRWMALLPDSAVDGCGVPTFHAPLSGMARAWAQLALAMMGEGDRETTLAGRVGWAMHELPELMSGEGRLDLAVVRGAAEDVTVKVGAEGLFCVAFPERARGLAVKVHTGNADALAVAVVAALERWFPEVWPARPWGWSEVRNVVGDVVGERRAAWG